MICCLQTFGGHCIRNCTVMYSCMLLPFDCNRNFSVDSTHVKILEPIQKASDFEQHKLI